MLNVRGLTAFIMVAGFACNTALAETRDFGVAGGYEVGGQASTRERGGGCIATFEYEGPGATKTTIYRTVSDDDADVIYLSIDNYGWSAKRDEKYEIMYVFGESFYKRSAWGIEDRYIRKGFMTGFPAEEFLDVFAREQSLILMMNGSVVDNLSLEGSSAGVSLFKKCWVWALSTERAAEAERERFKSIPRDPFAEQGEPDD